MLLTENSKKWLNDIVYSRKYTASTVDGKTPASLIFRYQPRTKCYLVSFTNNKVQSKIFFNQSLSGKIIWVLNHLSKIPSFIHGKIIKQMGYNTFLVKVNGRNKVFHRHHLHFDNLIRNNLIKCGSIQTKTITLILN